jgi:hypothetical protein
VLSCHTRWRARGEGKVAGRSAKASQLNADQEAWEANRMLQSGVALRGEVCTSSKYYNKL